MLCHRAARCPPTSHLGAQVIGGARAPTPVGELGFVEMTQAVDVSDYKWSQVREGRGCFVLCLLTEFAQCLAPVNLKAELPFLRV